MLYFWFSHLMVTLVGVGHTVFNIYVRHMQPMDGHSMGEGYEKTRPWHPLYNIILFSLFGWVLARHPWSLSFHGFHIDYQPWISLIYLAIFWGRWWAML